MPGKALIIDANILVRAVLGTRARAVIEAYCEDVNFFVPEAALSEAGGPLAGLAIKSGGDPEKVLALLGRLAALTEVVAPEVYGEFEQEAVNGSAREILRTGRSSPRRSPSDVRFGPRTRTSLDAASRFGRRAALRCSYVDKPADTSPDLSYVRTY